MFQCRDCKSNNVGKCVFRFPIYPIAQSCSSYRKNDTTTQLQVVETEQPKIEESKESFLYSSENSKHCIFYSKLY